MFVVARRDLVAGWFIWREGETVGPFSSEELARDVLDGRVGADHWIWHAGLGGWTPAGSFDFLTRQLHNASQSGLDARAAEARGRAEAEPPAAGEEARSPNEVSLTRLYLARLKREPLARLAVEASTIEVITRAEADQPVADGRSPDPLAERLATFLSADEVPEEATPPEFSGAPAADRPSREAHVIAETIGVARGDGSGDAPMSSRLVDLGIHVIRPAALQPRPSRPGPPPLPLPVPAE